LSGHLAGASAGRVREGEAKSTRAEVTVIYHQIRFSVKADVPKDELEAALERLRRLGRELEVVQFCAVGRDFGGDFDYGALYALPDIDAYRTYMYAPLHLETDAAGLPLVDDFVSQDLTDDEDPAIGDKIAEVQRNRFADHPEVLDLVVHLGSYTGSGVPDDVPGSK
jgi:stress responsive alpha/beta barrel protein